MPERVCYPSTEFNPHIVLERLDESAIKATAGDILQLVVRAYEHEFETDCDEQPELSLPKGTIAAHYRIQDDSSAEFFCNKLLRYRNEYQSQFWIVTSTGVPVTEQQLAISGFLKVSPSRATLAQKLRIQAPNLYINDVIVDPAVQGRGIGTALMHTAVTHADFDPRQTAVLDSFTGTSASAWYERIGFVASGSVSSPTAFGEHALPQTRYVSPSHLAISGIGAALETQHPWLSKAEASDS
jgi:ribosomal protein S18 acetylase RimI-like enzyme